MDPATLAAAAIAASLPYLISLGKEAAKGAASAAGKSVWEWVKGKLTSEAGKQAVRDMESSPEDSDNRKIAEATLSKLLKFHSSVRSELAQLLERAGAISATMSANIVGDGNIVGQASDFRLGSDQYRVGRASAFEGNLI